MKKKLILTCCVALLSVAITQANKLPYVPDSKSGKILARTSTGDCVAGASQTDLYINDVRARMLDDGDKWWDLNVAHYIVPQVAAGQTAVSSIFAGAIWVGGIDKGGQLKIAAATYRQNGNDWYPGPIPTNNGGNVTEAICSAYDNHWQVFGAEISSFITLTANLQQGQHIPISEVPSDILMWPGAGNVNNPVVSYAGPGAILAPFYSKIGDIIYDPTLGDIPCIQQDAGLKEKNLYGDQMIWWVYNDLGNIHTETHGVPIGMEVREEAWAYQTNDDINDMTFYHYQLVNTSTFELDSTFMAQWVDPDLGCYLDDYVGCDTTRSLGMDYNGEAIDGGNGSVCASSFPNYGDQPPIVGTTYFQGPHYRYHPVKGDTATRDTTLKMTSFIWYNNDFTVIGNPTYSVQYYGYMSGTWLDGTPFEYGGNGHASGGRPFKFMFPSDPTDAAGWSECQAHDVFGDRRYIQASGPFVLEAGAVNDIVVGAVWVRPPVGSYPCPSFSLIDKASDEAQALFNSDFAILNGPSAPDVTITELDRELVLNLVNTNTSAVEYYNQSDPAISALNKNKVIIRDSTYKFEGYQIYQLINNQVTAQNYTDITQAKLVAQCDVKDGVGTIINYVYSAEYNGNVPVLEVQGADAGIKHTFDFTTDAFAQTNPQLINFQPYYYSVISYAYNYYNVIDTTLNDSGKQVYTNPVQLLPYLAGRQNIAIYTGIPHKPTPEANGTIVNSFYGEGPYITRQQGRGNGGNFLDLTEASVDAILNSSNGFVAHPTYQLGEGPIEIKVIDPKRVPADSFVISLVDTGVFTRNKVDSPYYFYATNLDSSTTKWVIRNVTEGDTAESDTTIAVGNEQLFPQWGISVYINQVLGPGFNTRDNGGLISSEVVYANPKLSWLSGLPAQSQPSKFAWELSGTYYPTSKISSTKLSTDPNHDYVGVDDNQVYRGVINGTWAPYIMASPILTFTPAWKDPTGPPNLLSSNNPVTKNAYNTSNFSPDDSIPTKLDSLNSVDVVFTSDQTKWSKCVVVEEQALPTLAQGNATKDGLRQHQSWTGTVDGNGNPVYSTTTGDVGYSYFPGYAINVETGQRLNIFFGEDSWQVSQNGADMIWNPTSNVFSPVGDTLLGGQHYIYVSNTQYNGCATIYSQLSANTKPSFRETYSHIDWVGMTYLAAGSSLLPLSQGLIPTQTTVKIRVSKPYAVFTNPQLNPSSDSLPSYSFGLKNLAADTANTAIAKTALDSIEVVPNPYYAYSNYEQTALDNEIKFTNLPQVCTISIFTLEGQLVNTINYTGPYEEGKMNNITSTNWNLTNSAGVPIASGVYLIYFSSPGLGTKCIKWFGVRRPVDIGNF